VKNKKISKIISILLLFGLVAGIIPGGIGNLKVEAAGLEMPQRVRPTAETMWNPKNIKNTIATGEYHSLFITQTQTVKTVGGNDRGQLGNGTTNDSLEFVDVLGKDGVGLLNDVIAVSAGSYHSLALKSDGTVWAWGCNYYEGRLGDGTAVDKTTPVQVRGGESGEEFLTDIVAISTGYNHSLALKSDGTVWSWGDNEYGKLGDGTAVDKTTPVQVKGGESGEEFLTNIVAISAGDDHSLALKVDGTVWAWGNDGNGQLGDGTTVDKTTPVQVKGGETEEEPLVNIAAISSSAISNASFAIKSDGKIYGWGENGKGELGDGTTDDKSIPTEITFSGQKQVAVIPENLLYKFTSPKEREVYEGGKPLFIEWQLISDSVESFDIYYAPYEEWQDESTWIEIEKNVPTSELNPTPFVSDISDGNGGYLEGTKYQYNWTLPDEFIPHIRIIAIPHYK